MKRNAASNWVWWSHSHAHASCHVSCQLVAPFEPKWLFIKNNHYVFCAVSLLLDPITKTYDTIRKPYKLVCIIVQVEDTQKLWAWHPGMRQWSVVNMTPPSHTELCSQHSKAQQIEEMDWQLQQQIQSMTQKIINIIWQEGMVAIGRKLLATNSTNFEYVRQNNRWVIENRKGLLTNRPSPSG